MVVSTNWWQNRFIMAHQSIRCCVTFLSLSLALAASARGQSMVYVLESGRPPLSCSAGGCHGPTVHLINAATGHELAKIETAPQERKGTSLRLSSNGAQAGALPLKAP